MSAVFHDYVNLVFNTTAPAAQGGITGAAGDIAWAVVPYQCQVRRVAVVSGDANATGGVYTFAFRPTSGSDTGRTTFATMTKPAASQATTPYMWQDATTSVTLQEGGEVVLAGTAASGVVKAVCLVERKPEVLANIAKTVNVLA